MVSNGYEARRSRRLQLLVAAVTAATAVVATPAAALEIVLNDVGGVGGSQAAQGFLLAARYWQSVLTNNARVTIDVGLADLGDHTAGSTDLSWVMPIPVSDYRGALAATGTSALDAQAVASIPAAPSVLVPGYGSGVDGVDLSTSRVITGVPLSDSIGLTAANARALGFDPGAGSDASIVFSSRDVWDYDPSDGIDATRLDFLTAAIHEIGHALGFVSGVDGFDTYFQDVPDIDNSTGATGLDLFRYSAPQQLDWRPAAASYFSIDGGQTAFAGGYFSTGANGGDGSEASHWKSPGSGAGCSGVLGIMNPTVCPGVGGAVTGLDLAAFDVIGWNTDVALDGYSLSTAEIYRIYSAAVPEPGVWTVMVCGFALAGAALRRRRRMLRYALVRSGDGFRDGPPVV